MDAVFSHFIKKFKMMRGRTLTRRIRGRTKYYLNAKTFAHKFTGLRAYKVIGEDKSPAQICLEENLAFDWESSRRCPPSTKTINAWSEVIAGLEGTRK